MQGEPSIRCPLWKRRRSTNSIVDPVMESSLLHYRYNYRENLSIVDTAGTQLAVLYREMSLIRGRFVHGFMWLSSLERCPLVRVSFIERFHCS